ncbi:hypothetical protein P152DRAFT_30438 [Eremomyces bilateralis CBS 781.70]|uniref:Uncharacterized protein n=1 Tax=Eremomyces bilateralis CBS 781.70 TaxID=1392243 RepID=A0A6G1G2L4_9PEZI|nr:uncharacterized protein P152DRAFT_30438 [Eremomyces bilateralis CBS 781.70]KAF1812258.1 hypothetical protein P152DRAFT_30438 [Eremomyces bilateralis CBS 781.70]
MLDRRHVIVGPWHARLVRRWSSGFSFQNGQVIGSWEWGYGSFFKTGMVTRFGGLFYGFMGTGFSWEWVCGWDFTNYIWLTYLLLPVYHGSRLASVKGVL